MKNIVVILVLLLLCFGCSSNQNNIEKSDYLKVIKANNDFAVNQNSTIEADLNYNISNLEPGKYVISILFDLNEANSYFDGCDISHQCPVINVKNGDIHISFPIELILSKKDLAFPLKITFQIEKYLSPELSRIIATSNTVTYILEN